MAAPDPDLTRQSKSQFFGGMGLTGALIFSALMMMGIFYLVLMDGVAPQDGIVIEGRMLPTGVRSAG